MHMQQTQQQLPPIPMQPMQQLPVQQQPPHLQQVSLPGPFPAAGVQRLPVHIDRSKYQTVSGSLVSQPMQQTFTVQQLPTQMVNMQMPQTARTPWLRSMAPVHRRPGLPTSYLVPRLFSECNCSWLIHGMQYLVCACLSDSRTFSLAMLNKACDISVVSCVNTHRTPT